MQHIETVTYSSPCGDMVLGAIGGKLCLCDWIVEKHSARVASRLRRMLGVQIVNSPSDTTREAIRQLDQYFSRSRRDFHLPLLFAGTDFQVAVWRELLAIPYGQTATYGQLAQRIGRPKAVRAVANANGANAMSIIVPCHRVIGHGGHLVGYAGGMEAKRFLLGVETI